MLLLYFMKNLLLYNVSIHRNILKKSKDTYGLPVKDWLGFLFFLGSSFGSFTSSQKCVGRTGLCSEQNSGKFEQNGGKFEQNGGKFEQNGRKFEHNGQNGKLVYILHKKKDNRLVCCSQSLQLIVSNWLELILFEFQITLKRVEWIPTLNYFLIISDICYLFWLVYKIQQLNY